MIIVEALDEKIAFYRGLLALNNKGNNIDDSTMSLGYLKAISDVIGLADSTLVMDIKLIK